MKDKSSATWPGTVQLLIIWTGIVSMTWILVTHCR